MAAPTKYTARVVSRNVINIPVTAEKTVKVLRLTYQVAGFPPRTIWIDYDKATKENIMRMIAADLSKLLMRTVEVSVEGL